MTSGGPGARGAVTGVPADPFRIAKTPRADIATRRAPVRRAGCPRRLYQK
jgi:hypothetical protein